MLVVALACGCAALRSPVGVPTPLTARRAHIVALDARRAHIVALDNAVSDNVAALEGRRSRLLAELADVTRALEAAASEAQQQQDAVARGSASSAFEPSFGYLSRSAGVYTDDVSADGTNLPSGAVDLAVRNFRRELAELRKYLDGTEALSCATPGDCSDEAAALRAKLDRLVLSNDAVWAREKLRPAIKAPLVLLVPYYVLCWCLDAAFDGRPIARFWFLETVARMPYFSYVSALHLYESLGWWRRSAETKRVHFAEEWNEFHHLLTMEALGGDQLWRDRFLAQHAAIVYYYVLLALWALSPTLAYNFSELIEAHAVDTYGEFVDANRELLAELPAPRVSRMYWNGPDLFLFDEFQTARPRGSRRPPTDSLLDVFTNIRDDEAEHVATMRACQDPSVTVSAPTVEAALLATAAVGGAALALVAAGAGDESAVLDLANDLADAGDVEVLGSGLPLGALAEGATAIAAAAAAAQQVAQDILLELLDRLFGAGEP